MIIELKNITKSYTSATNISKTVLQNISFNINKGETIAIIGPSGSGKSTLLNIIGTLDRPTSGIIKFKDQDFSTLSDNQLAKIRNQNIGFIFQLHHLLPQCTILENVIIPTLPYTKKKDRKNIVLRANQLIERVGLADHKQKRHGQLSGGECQRVAVVRALINQPEIILADEPTGSLDSKNSEELGDLLLELNREQKTTLITVTHSDKLANRMNKTYRIENGKIFT